MDTVFSRVVALGSFDGVHAGHLALLTCARREADARALPLTALPFAPKTFPKPAPLLTEAEERQALLRAAGADEVVFLSYPDLCDLSPAAFVKDILIGRFHAALAVCGFNYRFGKDASGDAALLCRLMREAGADAVTVPAVSFGDEPISSSRIRAALARGDITEAQGMLGRPYAWTLPVRHGKALGRTLGFPTVNQVPSPRAALPRRGVWQSSVELDGIRYPALTNIGVRPTVDDGHRVDLETWIKGFSGDLYGRNLTVTLRAFLREERRFSSVKELKEQIELDKNSI